MTASPLCRIALALELAATLASGGSASEIWFEEVASGSGLDFVHVRAVESRLWFPEIMSGGGAWIDYDRDGDLDLFLTHIRQETNTFYLNQGGFFEDSTSTYGLAVPSLQRTGFGAGFSDFDHDGRQELFIANGRVGKGETTMVEDDPFAEPDLLLVGDLERGFAPVPPEIMVNPPVSRTAGRRSSETTTSVVTSTLPW